MSNPSVLHEFPYAIEKSEKSQPFWEGLNEGKLRSTRCLKCSTTHFPPAPILCVSCFSTEIEWVDLPLEGTLTSFTRVEKPPAGFDSTYILCVVQIKELEIPIVGRLQGNDQDLAIGDSLKITFEKVKDQSILIFSR